MITLAYTGERERETFGLSYVPWFYHIWRLQPFCFLVNNLSVISFHNPGHCLHLFQHGSQKIIEFTTLSMPRDYTDGTKTILITGVYEVKLNKSNNNISTNKLLQDITLHILFQSLKALKWKKGTRELCSIVEVGIQMLH